VLQAIGRSKGPVWAAELAARLGMSRQGIRGHLRALASKGFVRLTSRPRHGTLVELTLEGRAALRLGVLPVVGEIAAGTPTLAEEQIEAYAERLTDLLPVEPGDFLLRVTGDSMVGVGIFPGDYVVVRPFSGTPEAGTIVVALLPEENTATLKRFFREGKTAVLRSENPAYPPIRLPLEAIRIQGYVVGHLGDPRRRLKR